MYRDDSESGEACVVLLGCSTGIPMWGVKQAGHVRKRGKAGAQTAWKAC